MLTTVYANAGEDITYLQRHGEWQSTTGAESTQSVQENKNS